MSKSNVILKGDRANMRKRLTTYMLTGSVAKVAVTTILAMETVFVSAGQASERPHTKVIQNFKCSGKVENYFAGIADHSIGGGDSMCYFVSQSDIGRRILKICIVGSNCQVVGTVINDQDAGDWSPIITDIIKIERIAN
jgi:hypothetical protein